MPPSLAHPKTLRKASRRLRPLVAGSLMFGVMVALSGVLFYLVAVALLGSLLSWVGIQVVARAIHEQPLDGAVIWQVVGWTVAVVYWVMMVRILMPRKRPKPSGLLVTQVTQPALMATILQACEYQKLPSPEEVWLDTSVAPRWRLKNGLKGLIDGEIQMTLGLPTIRAFTSRELSVVLASSMAPYATGFCGLYLHLLEELQLHQYRAIHLRDPWNPLVPVAPLTGGVASRIGRRICAIFCAASRIPFGLVYGATWIICYLPLKGVRREEVYCTDKLLEPLQNSQLSEKNIRLRQASVAALDRLQDMLQAGKLPRHWPAFLHRRYLELSPLTNASTVTDGECDLEQGEAASSSESASGALLQDGDRLARSLSQQLYREIWSLPVNKLTQVAVDEESQEHQEEQLAVGALQRYFGGLAHPERCVFGLTRTHELDPSVELLKQTVRDVRTRIPEIEESFFTLLSSWNEAWTCRRDMEAAMALTQAGLSIAEIQFGLEEASTEDLQKEATRQRTRMETLEETLQGYEAHLERRFAAALGLVWWASPAELSDKLAVRQHDLARHVSVFEALSGVLPLFRELLTQQYAFQILAVRMNQFDDRTAALAPLQAVVPGMLRCAREIERGLDGALYPFGGSRQPVRLSRYLLPQKLPSDLTLTVGGNGIGGLATRLLNEGNSTIGPFVKKFQMLYHHTYGWLAETAEMAETTFLGACTGNNRKTGPTVSTIPSGRGPHRSD